MSNADAPVCHALEFPISIRDWPVNFGRKGPTWFLIFTRPRGIRMMREALPLNALWPTDPFPASSPEGHPRFALHSPLEPKLLTALADVRVARDGGGAAEPIVKLTGRIFGKQGGKAVVEVEVLLKETEVLRCCTHCFKWERMNCPAFLKCSACKVRFYCSQACQKADWKKSRHKTACPLLKDGKLAEAERHERMHQDQMQWQDSKMLRMGNDDHPMEREFDDDLDYADKDFFLYGARERYL